jgi:hypothetical protein
MTMPHELWPALPYDDWRDTYATLHMWCQVVGKVALALAPPLNHSWGSAFEVNARGLATHTLSYGERSLRISFDLIEHQLAIEASDGDRRVLPLSPRTVADFYGEVMDALRGMRVPLEIWPMPVEIPDPIRFDLDTTHRSYDPAMANRWWRILLQVQRVFSGCRCTFVGKCSPVHFFWGAFDLAVTRFSGRPAPPRDGPAFMREAYSHEVISHGFWPGSGPVLEPAFYAYAVPEPAALKEAQVRPDGAFYHRELGEFILPYERVRAAPSPDEAITEFVNTTYETASSLAGWDRAALEESSQASPR